jgi:hypothetical protein
MTSYRIFNTEGTRLLQSTDESSQFEIKYKEKISYLI